MNTWLAWLEQTDASVWMREEANAYFYALIFHAWGMALLVGGGVVVCLVVLGRGRVVALHRHFLALYGYYHTADRQNRHQNAQF